jgi:hypothetical protein
VQKQSLLKRPTNKQQYEFQKLSSSMEEGKQQDRINQNELAEEIEVNTKQALNCIHQTFIAYEFCVY